MLNVVCGLYFLGLWGHKSVQQKQQAGGRVQYILEQAQGGFQRQRKRAGLKASLCSIYPHAGMGSYHAMFCEGNVVVRKALFMRLQHQQQDSTQAPSGNRICTGA